MSLSDFLARLTGVFEDLGLDYMIAGSLASTVHGVARSTQDVDIVIALPRNRLADLLAALPQEDYYVSDTAAEEAVRRQSQFNVIDMATGWKADLVVQKHRPFSIEELGRRRRHTLLGVELYVASPEDTIIAKLEWARSGLSERHLRDIAGIIQARRQALDSAYIDRWVAALGLAAEWARARHLVAEGETPD
jgi:hypothetical protein